MIRTFTQNDLIRFIYRETTAQESRDIERSIEVNPELRSELDTLRKTMDCLDDAQLQPPTILYSSDDEQKWITA